MPKYYYAVARGRKIGIVESDKECPQETDDFGTIFKRCHSMEEAKDCLNQLIQQISLNKSLKNSDAYFGPSTSRTSIAEPLPEDGIVWEPDNDDPQETVPQTNCRNDRLPAHVYIAGAYFYLGQDHSTHGYGIYWGPNNSHNVSAHYPHGTLNAVIRAAIEAIITAKEAGLQEITIHNCWKHFVNSVTIWKKKWIKNDWKIKKGTEVKCRHQLEQLIEASKGIKVNYFLEPNRGVPEIQEAVRLALVPVEKEKPKIISMAAIEEFKKWFEETEDSSQNREERKDSIQLTI